MDYKYELNRFVSVCRQLVNNTQVSTRPYGYLCGSKAAWGVFLNALQMYEKIFQQGESANPKQESMTEREKTYRKLMLCNLILASIPMSHELEIDTLNITRCKLHASVIEANNTADYNPNDMTVSQSEEWKAIEKLLEL